MSSSGKEEDQEDDPTLLGIFLNHRPLTLSSLFIIPHTYGLPTHMALVRTVLRASQPARPSRDSLFTDVLRDGMSLLKVWKGVGGCMGEGGSGG